MTNEETPLSIGINDLDHDISWTLGVQDSLLHAVVEMTERGGVSGLGLTLNVQGQVITGALVSRTDWFAAVLSVSDGGGAELVEQFKEAYEDEADLDPTYLHLRGANMVSTERVTEGTGIHWRIRIADVSAWTFGQLSVQQPD